MLRRRGPGRGHAHTQDHRQRGDSARGMPRAPRPTAPTRETQPIPSTLLGLDAYLQFLDNEPSIGDVLLAVPRLGGDDGRAGGGVLPRLAVHRAGPRRAQPPPPSPPSPCPDSQRAAIQGGLPRRREPQVRCPSGAPQPTGCLALARPAHARGRTRRPPGVPRLGKRCGTLPCTTPDALLARGNAKGARPTAQAPSDRRPRLTPRAPPQSPQRWGQDDAGGGHRPHKPPKKGAI